MTWLPCPEPIPGDPRACDLIDTIIVPRSRDLGGFEVRRALPARSPPPNARWSAPSSSSTRWAPASSAPARAWTSARTLATVTYLFEGEIMHRDSLGSEVAIRPGAVNWMTAGRGIVHSERTPEALRGGGSRLFGLQTWVALPAAHEETEPAFAHTPETELPLIEDDGVRVRLVAGSAWGRTSPVKVFSDTLFADVALASGGKLPVDAAHEERALYTVSGAVEIAGVRFPAGQLLVLRPGDPVTVGNSGPEPAHFVLVGGETMDGPRHIWWNFVSSRKERIEQAKAEWKAGRFDTVPGDAEEFIPLPEKEKIVRYP